MAGCPRVLGSPGERARFSGLLRAALPLGAVLVLCGYALGAFIPWGNGLSAVLKAAIVVGLAVAIFLATAATQSRVDAFFKGARGEEQIALTLAGLPDGYTVLHGVVLGHGGLWRGLNLDHVVVGPTGLVLIETKNWQGVVTCQDGSLKVNGADPTRSPIDQIRAQSRILSAWLAERLPEAPPPVRPLICFAGEALEAVRITVDEITLCRSDGLIGTITQTPPPSTWDTATEARIIQLLARQV